MGIETGIQWTDHSFNPWWGCARVSPGCVHCYAETMAARWGTKWGTQAERRFFGDKHWNEPERWNKAAEKAGVRRRVFCASMADVFEDRRDLDVHRARLWKLITRTPNLDWQLLTKRPEHADRLWAQAMVDAFDGLPLIGPRWLSNVWLGTSVEDQKRADERIPELLGVPAAVRFLSVEPLLGPVDLGRYLWDDGESVEGIPAQPSSPRDSIGWVIVGGESGPGARPMQVEWARSIVRQCKDAGVSVFVKQLGARPTASYYDEAMREKYEHGGYDWPDPVGWHPGEGQPGAGALVSLTGHFSSKKGGDPEEWPEDLRVREFPEAGR